MKPDPPILDYAKPPPRRFGLASFVMGFIGGWLLGVVVAGTLADMIVMAKRGRPSDGGVYYLATYAIIIEAPLLLVLRAIYGGKRVNALFAFLFGIGCGLLLLGILILY